VYQVERDYVKTITPPEGGDDEDSTLTLVSSFIGTTTFDSDVLLGDRITTIIQYAKSKGLNITKGQIDDGINWYRTESKDRTCAEMIREMLKLMPDLVAWIDNTTSPARFNVTPRDSMPQQIYTIGQDNVTSHSVTRHDSERVPCVVIRYEKPITVDSENYTEIIEDIAPSNGDPTQLGTFIETVGIRGGVYQNEYARIVTDTIPQDDASEDSIKEWWIRYTPQLAAIAESQGLSDLRDLIKLPDDDVPEDNVKKHTVNVVDDGLEAPDPINPKSTPLVQTDAAADYPRHIIEGVLPEWAGKRYRPVRAEATLAIIKADAEAISDDALKASILAIFTDPKTFDGKDYLTALFTGQVTGTNAVSKNYKRVVTSDPGEDPPTGIARDLLSQLNQDRYSGSISVVGQDPDVITQVGQVINVNGGRSEWASMNETIQQVTHNVKDGTTDITFGPPQNLGANDLIDRLRASRVNQFGYRMQSGNAIEEGIGGGSAAPVFSFSIQNSGVIVDHPWLVTFAAGTSSVQATMKEGRILGGLNNIEEIDITLTTRTMVADDFMCIEYNYADETFKNVVVSEGNFESFTDDGGEPAVILTSTQPIAKVISKDGALIVEQYAMNHFAKVQACIDGEILTTLVPL
jgi:hypothetical protein